MHVVVRPLHSVGGPGPKIVQASVSAVSMSVMNRIFPMAQTRKPIPFVPSAWAHTRTTSSHATPPKRGMAVMRHWRRESRATYAYEGTTPPSVSSGKELGAVPAPSTTASTFALDAVLPITELTLALERRKLKAHTPYHPDAWEFALQEAGITQKYPHVVTGLRFGFIIDCPLIFATQAPPNRESIIEFVGEFTRIVHSEIQKGRYIGPISKNDLESLIGSFQSSPFSIIPKPGQVNKYRNIQNYSFPITPSVKFPNSSINSSVDSDSFPTTWGTFSLVALLIRRLPPGSQLATRDVAEAYRTIPLHHSQWPATIVRLEDDSFAIDTAMCFGSAPSAGTYGTVRNAASDILRFRGIRPVSSWVDDHLFFRIRCVFLPEYNQRRKAWNADIISRGEHRNGGRIWFGGREFDDGTLEEFDEDCAFPCRDLSELSARSAEDALYTYNFRDIDVISQELGIPWEISKDMPFASATTYIGFDWNIETYQVSLGAAKKEKYLRATQDWFMQPTHSLEEVEKLYGKLLHACLVIPMGRAYLTELERMLGIFHNSPFLPRSSPKGLRADLEWWIDTLRQPIITRSIPYPVSLYDAQAFSDASSGFGIAITIGNRWRAWRLIPGWQTLDGQRDIGWAEAIAFECLVRYLADDEKQERHFTVYGDNKGVVEGWWNGRSRNRAINDVFKRLHGFLRQGTVESSFHTVYVGSKFNPADAPSRGVYPPSSLLLPPAQLPTELNQFIVDSQSPFTATEWRARKEGRYSRAAAKWFDDANQRNKTSA